MNAYGYFLIGFFSGVLFLVLDFIARFAGGML